MAIKFITANKNKFLEIKSIISGLSQLDLDLPEIQSLDVKEIIECKLKAAEKHRKDGYVVEDTCLYLDALQGLPGPLIKWFIESIGNKGLYKVAKCYNNFSAKAQVVIGYSDEKGAVKYFEGVQKGTIVKPRGNLGWGWDPIFLPEGFDKTYGEMAPEEKYSISMRKLATDKLRRFLRGKSNF